MKNFDKNIYALGKKIKCATAILTNSFLLSKSPHHLPQRAETTIFILFIDKNIKQDHSQSHK